MVRSHRGAFPPCGCGQLYVLFGCCLPGPAVHLQGYVAAVYAAMHWKIQHTQAASSPTVQPVFNGAGGWDLPVWTTAWLWTWWTVCCHCSVRTVVVSWPHTFFFVSSCLKFEQLWQTHLNWLLVITNICLKKLTGSCWLPDILWYRVC